MDGRIPSPRGFAGPRARGRRSFSEGGKSGHDKHTSLGAAAIKVNKGFKLRAAVYASYVLPKALLSSGAKRKAGKRDGDKLADQFIQRRAARAYFIPTWTIIAFQIMVSP